jgi:hypothetical protein
MQDERWEFDLDLPRSEEDDPVRDEQMERAGGEYVRHLYRIMRERFGPTGPWR